MGQLRLDSCVDRPHVPTLLFRCLSAAARLLSRWSTPAWDAYARWESRPFHNGDGI